MSLLGRSYREFSVGAFVDRCNDGVTENCRAEILARASAGRYKDGATETVL